MVRISLTQRLLASALVAAAGSLACGSAAETAADDAGAPVADGGRPLHDAAVPSLFIDAGARDAVGLEQDGPTEAATDDARPACPAGTDFQNDVNNCGGCRNVCGANAAAETPQCVAGICRTVTTLVTGQVHPSTIALSGTGNGALAIWIDSGAGLNEGSIHRLFLFDGATDVLASNQGFPEGLSITDGWAFWADMGTPQQMIMNADLVTLRGTNVVDASTVAQAVIADSTYVYWADSIGQTISRSGWPLSNQTPGPLAQNLLLPTNATLQQNVDSLFFPNDLHICSVPKVGGGITNLAALTSSNVEAFVADDANLYYQTNQELWTVPMTPGGTAVRIAQGVSFYALAVDGTSVYGPDMTTMTIRRIPRTGGAAVAIAKLNGDVNGIAVDGANVYWTNDVDGTVRRTSK